LGCGTGEGGPETESRSAAETALPDTARAAARVAASKETVLDSTGSLGGVDFRENYLYRYFDTNGRYLAWVEMYADSLYVYDLQARQMAQTIKLVKGRGPGQLAQISGLTVTDGGAVYLSDTNRAKFLRVDVETGEVADVSLTKSGLRPSRVDALGDLLVAANLSPLSLLGTVDLAASEPSFQPASGLDAKAEFDTVFFQVGFLDAAPGRAVYLTQYRPRIYTFRAGSEGWTHAHTAVYAESDVQMPDAKKRDDGAVVQRPPTEVDVEGKGVEVVPGRPNRAFVWADGEGGTRTFDPATAYEIDVTSGEIVDAHDVGAVIEEIIATDDALYVYSEDDQAMYEWALRFE
jgi:hypothetical protein